MRIVLLCFASLFLSIFSAVAAEKDTFWDTEYYALVIPAEVINDFGRGHEKSFEGVAFPLFCGFVTIDLKKNAFVFTKETNLPITWVEERIGQIEKDGYVILSPCNRIQVHVKDEGFSSIFWSQMEMFRIGLYRTFGMGDEDKPIFEKQCVFNGKNKPPVACAYTYEDMKKLKYHFGWEDVPDKKE